MSDITFIIKTFERPLHLDYLIKSIKKYYPNVKIMVADDSLKPTYRTDVDYYILPFDTGVSEGRNFLVDKVKTKYFLLLDDDFFFTEETRIEDLLKWADKYDIVGGAVRTNGEIVDYVGYFEKVGKTVYYRKGDRIEFIPFFFLSKPDVKWDSYLKTTEHFDFFYGLDKKIGYNKSVIIEHKPIHLNESNFYREHRNRREEYLKYILNKHGLDKLVTFTETICR